MRMQVVSVKKLLGNRLAEDVGGVGLACSLTFYC